MPRVIASMACSPSTLKMSPSSATITLRVPPNSSIKRSYVWYSRVSFATQALRSLLMVTTSACVARASAAAMMSPDSGRRQRKMPRASRWGCQTMGVQVRYGVSSARRVKAAAVSPRL